MAFSGNTTTMVVAGVAVACGGAAAWYMYNTSGKASASSNNSGSIVEPAGASPAPDIVATPAVVVPSTQTSAQTPSVQPSGSEASAGRSAPLPSDPPASAPAEPAAETLSPEAAAIAAAEAAARREQEALSDALMLFINTVGADVNIEAATFWLESSGYVVETAVSAYYENGGGAPGASSFRVEQREEMDPPAGRTMREPLGRGGRGQLGGQIGRQAAAMARSFVPDLDGGGSFSGGGGSFGGGSGFGGGSSGFGGDDMGFEEMTTPDGGVEYRPRQAVRAAAEASVSVGVLEYDALPPLVWEGVCTRSIFGDEAVTQPACLIGGHARGRSVDTPRVCAGCAKTCQAENSNLQFDARFGEPFTCACAEWADSAAGCLYRGRDPEVLEATQRDAMLQQLAAASAPMQSVVRKLLAAVTNENLADMVELNEPDVAVPSFELALHIHLRMRFAAGPSSDLGRQLTGLGVFFRDWRGGLGKEANVAIAYTALKAATRILELSKETLSAPWGHAALALAGLLEQAPEAGRQLESLNRAADLYRAAMQAFAADDAVLLSGAAEALDRITALIADLAQTPQQ